MAQPPATRLTAQQIAQMAAARGYDPNAVLAVSKQEGLGGGIGDGGHAYGPFQLNNAGGVITQQYGGRVNDPSVQDWAWSPQGVSYALDRMGAAKGLRGAAAIKAIVSQFERPADPQGEIARALAAYGGGGQMPDNGAGGGGGGVAPLEPPAPRVAPDQRGMLLRALQGAGGGDYSGFYQQLGNVLRNRQAAPVAPMTQPAAGGGAPQQPLPPGRGQIIGNTAGEQPQFVQALAALAGYEHAPVAINSGYRSTQKQAQLYANRASNPNPVAPPGHSFHEQGLAADGTVGGKPLGTLPAALLARFGLQPVPNDPVHVQLLRGGR